MYTLSSILLSNIPLLLALSLPSTHHKLVVSHARPPGTLEFLDSENYLPSVDDSLTPCSERLNSRICSAVIFSLSRRSILST